MNLKQYVFFAATLVCSRQSFSGEADGAAVKAREQRIVDAHIRLLARATDGQSLRFRVILAGVVRMQALRDLVTEPTERIISRL